MTETRRSEANEARTVRITVVIQNRFSLDTKDVTGRQIKEMASIPAGFSLHRRMNGANEEVADDQPVEVHDGDHFYAQPLHQPRLGHREAP